MVSYESRLQARIELAIPGTGYPLPQLLKNDCPVFQVSESYLQKLPVFPESLFNASVIYRLIPGVPQKTSDNSVRVS